MDSNSIGTILVRGEEPIDILSGAWSISLGGYDWSTGLCESGLHLKRSECSREDNKQEAAELAIKRRKREQHTANDFGWKVQSLLQESLEVERERRRREGERECVCGGGERVWGEGEIVEQLGAVRVCRAVTVLPNSHRTSPRTSPPKVTTSGKPETARSLSTRPRT